MIIENSEIIDIEYSNISSNNANTDGGGIHIFNSKDIRI